MDKCLNYFFIILQKFQSIVETGNFMPFGGSLNDNPDAVGQSEI